MRQFGLIGRNINYSFSPGYFKQKFNELGITDCRYDLFPLVDIDMITELFTVVKGLNVTIPYKQEVIPYCTRLSVEAQRINAVNCIDIRDGEMIGYNTDYYGFRSSLEQFLGVELHDVKALVLGQGGAAAAVKTVLEDLNIDYLPISRSEPYKTYGELTKADIKDHQLIINTTPLGMDTLIDECPEIDYNAISSKHFLYDLIYNPEKTLFLKHGIKQGAKTKNGQKMLELQAEKSWEIWTQNSM